MKNKSTFYQLLRRDVIYSISYGKYKYLAFLLLISILAIGKILSIKEFGAGSVDVLFMLIKDEGYFVNLTEFTLPVNWIFIQFVVLFLISDYFVQDLENNSIYLHLRTKSKILFILSKILWLIWQTFILFIGIWITVYLVSSLILGHFSLDVTPFYKETIASQLQMDVTPWQLVIHMIVSYVLTTVALLIIQLLLGQFLAPVVSFLTVVLLGCISMIVDSKWFPAIHSMILKKDIFDINHHLSIQFSISYCVIIIIALSIITTYIYQRKDIL